MKLLLWSVGKQNDNYVKEGIEDFTKRISKYFACEWKLIPPPKNAAALDIPTQKEIESQTILHHIPTTDYMILLDERGKMLTSPAFAKLLNGRAINGTKNIHFVIGGWRVFLCKYKINTTKWNILPTRNYCP